MYANPNLVDVLKTQQVAISDTSAKSAAVGASTNCITVWATVDFWLTRQIGTTDPTAVGTPGANIKIPARAMVSLPITPGKKIAAICEATITGELNIWERMV